MANTLTNSGRAAFLTASMGWLAGSVPGTWVPYIVGSFAPVPADLVFLSDIPFAAGAAWRARGTYLVSKTVASGIADAADTIVAGVGSAGSATAVYIVLVNETNASNTSLIGAVIDTASGLPFLPNGGDISIAWDDGASRIFKL
jgi:hypothetical protein